ncbi:MAG: hypothetical protein QXK86_08430 [Candidatus Bathyarchaeia archaeon]
MREMKQKMPSRKEVFKFMVREAQPYKFEYVKENQPLRVNIEKKLIYVNEQVLLSVIRDLISDGLDWKEVMKKNLKHEKAHEKFFEWNLKWASSGGSAESYGWLASYLTDIVIDKIYYANDSQYQKWLITDSRHAFNITKRDLWKLFPNLHNRPPFLYNQAAYWVAIGAITLEEATELYPEKADYITELSQLFKKIKSEKDLEWAFPQAKALFFKHFQIL